MLLKKPFVYVYESTHFRLCSVEEEEQRTTLVLIFTHYFVLSQRLWPAVAYAMLADLQASGGSNGSSHCSGNAGITKAPDLIIDGCEPPCGC